MHQPKHRRGVTANATMTDALPNRAKCVNDQRFDCRAVACPRHRPATYALLAARHRGAEANAPQFYGACGVLGCADCLPLYDENNVPIPGASVAEAND